MDSCISSSLLSQPSVLSEGEADRVSVVIRPAQFRDLRGLAEVLTRGFHPTSGWLVWLYPLLKLGIYEDLRHRLGSSSPFHTCLVASLPAAGGDRIVGTVEIALRPSCPWGKTHPQSLYISNLVVAGDYRRQGVARKLLLKCDQIALEWGFTVLCLHVLENNQPAKQLYFSSGYALELVEPYLGHWLFNQPRRLFLTKALTSSQTKLSLSRRDPRL
ncbi:MAG: GNAT family N-acetyltransferase [Chloroflexaceae bacterium]|nr:GNAT family N-acetyltransferase [Chloroflexaceae bacterium]